MNREDVIKCVKSEGDSGPDFLAWTVRQPRKKVPATYDRPGNVWETLTAFLNQELDKLPADVTKTSILYLLQPEDKKCWMLYVILVWILSDEYNTYGMNFPLNKNRILRMFREIQDKQQHLSR